MKANIKTYKVNATLFVNGEFFNLNWDGMKFDTIEEYNEWIEDELNIALSCENYEDVKTQLEIATDYLRPERVTNIECTRDGHQGITLTFEVDGIPYEVTGEFFIDKNGVLHHTIADPKDESKEIEITYQYFND